MKAILSDIHGNLEALRAVLDDVGHQSVEEIYNLGDTTGYGPNPIECIQLSMSMNVVLLGNHDQAVLFPPEGWMTMVHAERAVNWTRDLLKSQAPELLQYLAGLRSSRQEHKVNYVHGSPRNPVNEYVFPEDICNEKKMTNVGAKFDSLCFAGHTHIPGIFVENGPLFWQHFSPRECGERFVLNGRKVICNVGSAGQPRDGDWRASYVLFDESTVVFRRVEYEIDTTVAKIRATEELDNWLGDRLRDGR